MIKEIDNEGLEFLRSKLSEKFSRETKNPEDVADDTDQNEEEISLDEAVLQTFLNKKFLYVNDNKKVTSKIISIKKSKRGLFHFTIKTSHYTPSALWQACDMITDILEEQFGIDNFEYQWESDEKTT